MPRALILSVIGLLLLACERPAPPPPPVDDIPPDGSAHYLDADGVARTLLTPLRTLRYGDRVEDALPAANALSGYEFAGSAGDTPTIILDVQGDARVSLALYGLRDDTGLWGRPLRAISGEGVLRISAVELPADGYFFILVRTLVGGPANYALALDCPDCGDPLCPDIEPCDLYCEQGYAERDDGCRGCACLADAACEDDDGCLTGEVCREGVCRPAPTCAQQCADAPLEPVCDGENTWPNRCVADCEGVGEVRPGPCVEEGCSPERPCPDGQACEAGRCVCDCPPEVAQVCAEDGRTFSNLCQLQCAGAVLAYEGGCAGPPLTTACEDDARCPRGQVCAGRGDGPGICTVECRIDMGCNRGICTRDVDRFVCLPPCGPDGRCPEALACLPDERGVDVCAPCDCPAVDEPVCADGRIEYPSRCAARCMGVGDGRLADGPCEGGPVEVDCRRCPREWAPVCADGALRATLCDAECGNQPAREVDEAGACFERPPPTACAVDDDCVSSGEGTVCAAQRTAEMPVLGPEARCFVAFGACGCIEGTCGFRPARRELDRCLDRARQPRF